MFSNNQREYNMLIDNFGQTCVTVVFQLLLVQRTEFYMH